MQAPSSLSRAFLCSCLRLNSLQGVDVWREGGAPQGQSSGMITGQLGFLDGI